MLVLLTKSTDLTERSLCPTQTLLFSNYSVLHVFMVSEKDTNMAETNFLLSESLIDETYRLLRHRTIICEGLC